MKKLSPKIKKLTKYYTLKVIGLIILGIFALTTLFPYLYMVSNSFKSSDETFLSFSIISFW